MLTLSPAWAYTLSLPHDPRTSAVARSTLRTVLRCHQQADLTEVAELLASELVTNAYLHTTGPCAIRLKSVGPERLRVAVWDADPVIPAGFGMHNAPIAEYDDEGGRGLPLVRACADAWGGYLLNGQGQFSGGKLLWAECVRKLE